MVKPFGWTKQFHLWKFAMGYEKNISFLVTLRSSKFEKKSWKNQTGFLKKLKTRHWWICQVMLVQTNYLSEMLQYIFESKLRHWQNPQASWYPWPVWVSHVLIFQTEAISAKMSSCTPVCPYCSIIY